MQISQERYQPFHGQEIGIEHGTSGSDTAVQGRNLAGLRAFYHRAGTAITRGTAFLGAMQTKLFAQHFQQA